MAEKRMFAKSIINSDAFLDMPQSAQNLYFHLGMRADDEGFLDNANAIRRLVGGTEDDLKLLIAKGFLISYDQVIVITHWYINNQIRKDRAKDTLYQQAKKLLKVSKNGAYEIVSTKCQPNVNQMSTKCQPSVNQMSAQYSIDKISIEEDSIEESIEEEKETLDQLYTRLCPNLRAYSVFKYHGQVLELQEMIDNGSISLEDVEKGFRMANDSNFLAGQNDRDWKADFDWLINPKNLIKVLNGNYKNPKKTGNKKKTNIMEHNYDFDEIRRRKLQNAK